MPKFRQTYTKIVESLDVNALPDDFTRLMWTFLPLISCREGRGMAMDSWLKSKVFPLRTDIEPNQCIEAMGHMVDLGMVEVYKVDGRLYYQITNFHQYQSGTHKEAESPFPAPLPEVKEEELSSDGVSPELVRSSDGVAEEQVNTNSASYAYADSDAYADSESGGGIASNGSKATNTPASNGTSSSPPPPDRVLLHEFRSLLESGGISANVAVELTGGLVREGYQPDYVRRHIAWYKSKKKPVSHLVQALRSRDEAPDISCKRCSGDLDISGKCPECEVAMAAVMER